MCQRANAPNNAEEKQMSTELTTTTSTVAPQGITLQEYGEKLKLPADLLGTIGLTDIHYSGQAAVKIPYFDSGGQEVAAKFMVSNPASNGGSAFVWKKGVKPVPYGLWRLQDAVSKGYVVIVGSETESHVLWHHNVPSLAVTDESVRGLVECLTPLPEIRNIAVVKNGVGSAHALRLLGGSSLKPKVTVVTLMGGHTSLASIHVQSPDLLGEPPKALSESCTLEDYEAQVRQRRAAELWESCKDLAGQPDILGAFAKDLERSGIVGEERLAKLLYLAVTSRLLNRPVSIAVKGQSSCGKSVTTEGTLKFFPASACHKLSSMSEKALLYSPEPFEHRMLVVFELDGVRSRFGTYIIRTLLSEGRISYEVTANVGGECTTRVIEKDGPTGLIITTTQTKWHHENETRMLSVNVDDSPEQTRRVLAAVATQDRPEVGTAPWHALQEWLELSEHRVAIPFAGDISVLMPEGLPPRVRRDFPALLSLIKAHAILHQASRPRDEKGCIVATLADYAVVRDLVADLLAQSLQNAVSQTMRETVKAVASMTAASPGGVSETVLAGVLGLDKSVVSRRLKVASEAGYVKNLELKAGRPARWVLGNPMPEDQQLLPTVEQLEVLRSCSPKS
jgi:hypothetical protein